MLLSKSMVQRGNFLFRWRSYILLVFLPPLIFSLSEPELVATVVGDGLEDIYEYVCLLIIIAGVAVRIATIGYAPAGTSGRTTRRQIADELNTTGMYAMTRNPLYLGNCAIILGITLFSQSLLLSVALALFLVIYYERIILAEEAFLTEKFGQTYVDWAVRTPVFLPTIRKWQAPKLSFSWRSVIRRDYTSWFLVVTALFTIEASRDYLTNGNTVGTGWLAMFMIASLAYCLIRLIKKKTGLLTVEGR